MSIRTVGLWLSLKSTNSRCQTGVKRLKTTYKGYVVKKPAVCFHLTLKPAPACAAHFNRSSVQNRRVWFTQTENSSRKTLTTTETTNVGRTSSFVLNMLISGQPWQSQNNSESRFLNPFVLSIWPGLLPSPANVLALRKYFLSSSKPSRKQSIFIFWPIRCSTTLFKTQGRDGRFASVSGEESIDLTGLAKSSTPQNSNSKFFASSDQAVRHSGKALTVQTPRQVRTATLSTRCLSSCSIDDWHFALETVAAVTWPALSMNLQRSHVSAPQRVRVT